MYRPWALVMVKDVLAASGLFLRRFFEYDVGTWGSIYWRKFGVFRWLDNWEWSYKLKAYWLDRIGRQSKWSFLNSMQ
jgi:hypothetical protein